MLQTARTKGRQQYIHTSACSDNSRSCWKAPSTRILSSFSSVAAETSGPPYVVDPSATESERPREYAIRNIARETCSEMSVAGPGDLKSRRWCGSATRAKRLSFLPPLDFDRDEHRTSSSSTPSPPSCYDMNATQYPQPSCSSHWVSNQHQRIAQLIPLDLTIQKASWSTRARPSSWPFIRSLVSS